MCEGYVQYKIKFGQPIRYLLFVKFYDGYELETLKVEINNKHTNRKYL